MPHLPSDVAWVMISTLGLTITALCTVIKKLYNDVQVSQRHLLEFVTGVRNIKNGG